MARPKLTEEQRAEARRRIADAAIALYAEGGLKAATMRAIAKRLDVAPSWLYLHYSSHYDLLTAVWRDKLADTLQAMQDYARQETDPVARLRGLLERYARFALDNPTIYENAFMIMERPEDMPKPKPKSAMIPWEKLVAEAVKEAQEARRAPKGDPHVIAQALWGIVHGNVAIATNLRRFDFADKKARIDTALELAMASFGDAGGGETSRAPARPG